MLDTLNSPCKLEHRTCEYSKTRCLNRRFACLYQKKNVAPLLTPVLPGPPTYALTNVSHKTTSYSSGREQRSVRALPTKQVTLFCYGNIHRVTVARLGLQGSLVFSYFLEGGYSNTRSSALYPGLGVMINLPSHRSNMSTLLWWRGSW